MNSPLRSMSLLLIIVLLQGVLCTVEYDVVNSDSSSSYKVYIRDRRQANPNSSSPSPTTAHSGPTTQPPFTAADGSTIDIGVRHPGSKNYYVVTDVTNPRATRWVTINDGEPDVVSHVSLQDAHRLAVKIRLKFEFLFYGHSVRSVTIATGGFLYMSEFLHSFLTASQYIAPLMANFDTRIGNNSEILYKSTDSLFICEWRNVILKDQQDFGAYTFQAQLYKDTGNIILAYQQVPRSPDNISSVNHPVKVGLSDAFYWDVQYYRTIYPYHTVAIPIPQVKDNASILLLHKQTCNMFETCNECLVGDTQFKCFWCSKLEKCSDSYDRLRQDWLDMGCPHNKTDSFTQESCTLMFTTPEVPQPVKATTQRNAKVAQSVGAGIATFLLLMLLIAVVFIVYGYRNPESFFGQWMIRNRPSELARKFKVWRNSDRQNNDNMQHIG